MDLTAWESFPASTRDGLIISVTVDDLRGDRFFVPTWMARAFANAILSDIEFAARTKRDNNRRMLRGTYTHQFWCEPCLMEVDAPGVPAITHVYHGGNAVCCVCGFRRESNDSETDARSVGVDS